MRNKKINPLNQNEQISVFKAIKESNVDYIHSKIVNQDLVNLHLDQIDSIDIPSIFKYSPPLISIAAYYSSKPVFDILYMNSAKVTEVDRILYQILIIFKKFKN